MASTLFLPPFYQEGEAFFPARPLFDALQASNYSQWAKALGVVKVKVATIIGTQDVDALHAFEYFKAVFGSRSPSAAQVQDEVVSKILEGLALVDGAAVPVAPALAPAAVPVVIQEAPAAEPEPPQTPFDVISTPPPKPETPKLAMSKKVFDMLDTLDCYRSQVYGMGKAITAMRAAIESIAEKYTMPEDAWLNCQLEQVMALMPDDALETQFLQDDIWQFYALHVQDRPWLEASTLRSN